MAKCLISGLLILLFSGASMAVQEPKYSVIEKFGDIDLRYYRPMIVAETTISGSLGEASSAGFKTIAESERNYATIHFSDLTSGAKIAKLTSELMAWMATKGIKPTGKPEIARYNPPWTLPFLRRNEIMVTY